MRPAGLTVLALLLGALAPSGCSKSRPTVLGSVRVGGGDTGASGGSAGSFGSAGSGANGGRGGTTVLPPTGGSGDETGDGGACAQAKAEAKLVREPIDIVIVLDNSGSMDEELDSVERNINESFAGILDRSMVDYRVILVSRHRKEERMPAMPGAEDTSVCIEAPLSGLDECPSQNPVFSARFFHYFTKIESKDSFDVTLDAYEPPFDVEHEDRAGQAPNGWSEWLRPGAKKVFLELTDDDEDTSAADFVEALQTMAPEHFGTDPSAPKLVFHSIIGVAEKNDRTAPYLPSEPITDERCPSVTSAGRTYQELSILTGGLRFPLCNFDAYDVVFRRISEDVVTRTQIACDFDIPPPPPGKDLERDKVAVNYVPGSGAGALELLQASTPVDCGPDAFYIEDQRRIVLCPEACAIVQADEAARVDVLFTCESTIIVR